MRCPFCRNDNDRVIDSRANPDGFAIRRRRQCVSCRRRYTTYERIEESTIKVIKKDGARVPFQREKLRRGLEKACWKRPVSGPQIEGLVLVIENELYQTFESEVDSRYVGELVMRRLREVDEVAFVRFVSVYREFSDVHDFVRELQPMLNQAKADRDRSDEVRNAK